jgi:hypothetical protein
VNDPAVPTFITETMVPVAAPQVLFAGMVAVPPLAFDKVTNSPASAVPNVYVVPVCALMVAALKAVFKADAVSTDPAVKLTMVPFP